MVNIHLTNELHKIRKCLRGCPGVPVHGGIPFVFTSIHGVVMQFVNVSFLCVPVHEDTTMFEGISWRGESKTDNDELMAQRINWCKKKKIYPMIMCYGTVMSVL